MATKRGTVARLYDAIRSPDRWVIEKAVAAYGRIAQRPRQRSGEELMAGLMPLSPGASGPGAWQWERAEQVRHLRHWVYTCVQFFQTQVTQQPPNVAWAVDPGEVEKHYHALKAYRYRRTLTPPEPRRFVPPSVRKSAAGSMRPHEELEYVDTRHPLLELLLNPNEPDTWLTFWRQAIMYYKLTGVNYTWMVPGENSDAVSELWNIPAHWVRPVCDGVDKLVDYYEVTPYGSGGEGLVRFEPDEIIEVKDVHPWNLIGAQSPLQANSEIIDQYESVQQSRYWSTKNGAYIGAVLEMTDEDTYPTDDDIRRLEAKWLSRVSGEVNAQRPQIVPKGLKLSRFDSATELAFLQSTDQLRDYVVSQTFRLSKTSLGITEGVPWATFVGEMRRVITQVINPELALFGGIFTEKLAAKYDPRLRIFWSLKSPNDDAQRLAEWTATPGPAVTVNEYRAQVLDLEPLDDPQYDEPLTPAGSIPGGPLGAEAFDGIGAPMQNPGGSEDTGAP